MDINSILLKAELAKALVEGRPPAGWAAIEAEAASQSLRRLTAQPSAFGMPHLEASKAIADALKISAGASFGVDPAKLVAGFTPTLPKLPEIPSYIPEPTSLAEYCRPVYSAPPMPDLDDTIDERISDLECKLERAEAEKHAAVAEAQELRAKNEALWRQVRHLKQRLDKPAFRNLVDYPPADVPPNDSPFWTE